MVYLWSVPNDYQEKDWGLYDYETWPDIFLLKAGHQLTTEEFVKPVKIKFDLSKKEVIKRDYLLNNTLVPLVNEKPKKILKDFAPNAVQFFPTICVCSDGNIKDYYFVNVTQLITGIDHEKSKYSLIAGTEAILGFTYVTYKKDCMGTHNLARDQEYKGHILVSEKVKLAFDKEKVTGVWLAKPEEFYRPLSELL